VTNHSSIAPLDQPLLCLTIHPHQSSTRRAI
jgi:hypothetical protein